MTKHTYYLSMLRRIRPLKATPRIWNYLKFRALPRRAQTSWARTSPQIASLLLTKRCNMNCSFCNVASFMHDESTTWRSVEGDLEKVQRIFDNPLFSRALLVDLLGGEPLLVKELVPIVAFLSERGHLTNMTTNGLLLADRIKDLKEAGISRISISIYEGNRAVLERDLASITKVFPVHTSMLLFRKEVEHAPEKIIQTARILRDAGCLDLRFWIYRPIGEHPHPEEILFEDDPAFLAFRRRMDEALPGFCFWPAPAKKGPVRKLCPQLWQRVGCDMAGNLGVCCGTDEFLPGPGGNLFEGDPDKVFNHPLLVRMREQLLDPAAEPPEMCKSCNLLGDPGW
jgi:Radical SAM superfamily/4Fe-4S single cluster domain